jgi:hypothetical protein
METSRRTIVPTFEIKDVITASRRERSRCAAVPEGVRSAVDIKRIH